VAADRQVEEIRRLLKVESLGYLSIGGLKKAVGRGDQGYCDACFTGNYPVPVQLEMGKLDLERD
jgi:amidophosphoribosyltransferase